MASCGSTEALSSKPGEDVESLFALGGQYFKTARYAEAAMLYSELLQRSALSDANRERALSNRSACNALRKEYLLALNDAKEVVRLNPNTAKGYGRLGTAYHGLKHYEEAANAYKRAAELDPSNPTYKEQQLSMHSLLSDGQGIASEDTRQGFYYSTSLQKAKEAMTQNKYFEAVRHYTKAIESCPAALRPPSAHETLPTNGLENTSSEYREYAALLCNRSAAYFKAGGVENYTKSLDDATQASLLSVSYARAHYRMALAFEALDRIPEAHDAAESCMTVDPEHADGKVLLERLSEAVRKLSRTAAEKNELVKEEMEKAYLGFRPPEKGANAATNERVVRSHGPAHATSYMRCSYCNEVGHLRAECPLRTRKRARD